MSAPLRLRVVAPGLATTVQDRGRLGYEHLGVMINGALDTRAALWANRLVGNGDEAAVLEMTLLGATLEVEQIGSGRDRGSAQPLRAALTGADLGCTLNGEPWVPDTVRTLGAGDRIACGPARRGVRAYLAFSGGIAVPSVLGSRATDLLAGLGGLEGRMLRAGDVLPLGDPASTGVGACAAPDSAFAAFEPPATLLEREIVRVLPGHRAAGAARKGLQRLIDTWYRVDVRSDRVGLRLSGPKVEAAVRGDEISEGMAIGAIEITSTGEPLLLMRSRGSIGGYPTLAVVISADLPALAQRKPGDRLRFTLVGEAAALEAWRRQRAVTLLSPAWALVTRETRPGEPALARTGEHVEVGAPLAVLEVMGARRVLRAPVAGRMVRTLVREGDAASEGAPVCELLADE